MWTEELIGTLVGIFVFSFGLGFGWILLLPFISIEEDFLEPHTYEPPIRSKVKKPKPARRQTKKPKPVKQPTKTAVVSKTYIEQATSQNLIDDAILALRNLGFKKRDAVIAVERACNGKVFTNVEDVIIATFDRSNV